MDLWSNEFQELVFQMYGRGSFPNIWMRDFIFAEFIFGTIETYKLSILPDVHLCEDNVVLLIMAASDM